MYQERDIKERNTNMKRYEPFNFENYTKASLLEAVVNPQNYLNDIQLKLDKYVNKIQNKNYNAPSLCFKLGWLLSSDRIRIKYENKIIPSLDPTSSVGINSGACIPDKKSTIQICMNDNFTRIQKDINFAKEFKKWFLFELNHELIHRGQNLAIKDANLRAQVMIKDNSTIKKQLADKQEIMARAWEIIELYRLLSNMPKNDILKFIKEYSKYSNNQTLSAYFYLFGAGSPEIKLLYKYMYEYLEIE